MQCVNFTDDELWQAIAANTDAVSDLLQQRADLEAEISGIADPARRTELMSSYVSTATRFDTEYRAYAAEIRRRYSL